MANLAMCLVAATALAFPASILAYPFSIAAPEPITVLYSFFGGRLLILTTFCLLGVLFLWAVRLAAHAPAHFAPKLLGLAVPLIVVFIVVYPSGSQDIFHNMADARTLWLHGQWPMSTPPGAHPDDPIVAHVTAWKHTTTTYGPLAYLLFSIPSILAGDDILANLIAFKAFGGCLLLVLAALVAFGARSIGSNRIAQATVIVAWNPLLLFEMVGNGHNDVVMSLLALISLLLVARYRNLASLLSVSLSASVKYATAAAAPITWGWLWLNSRGRQRIELIIAGFVAAIAFIALYLRFGYGLLTAPGPAAGQGVVASPASFIAYAIEPWLGAESVDVARRLCFLAFAMFAVSLVMRMKPDRRHLYSTWFWVLLMLPLLTATQVYPWYLTWSIPLAAILAGSLEGDTALIATVLGLVSYAVVPWVPVQIRDGALRPDALFNAAVVSAFFVAPAMYIILRRSRSRLPTSVEGER